MKKNRRRTTLAAALVVTGVVGLGVASAAQLGLQTATLGAGTTVVASCQPEDRPIGVSFETAFAAGGHVVTAVTLTDVVCDGQAVRIALTSGANQIGDEVVGTVEEDGQNRFALTTPVPAAEVDGAAVVIHG